MFAVARPRAVRTSRSRLAIVLLLVATVVLTLAAGLPFASASGLPAHHAAAAPSQRVGSAAGRSHTVGRASNRTVPRSLRSRYPLLHLGVDAHGRNTARFVAAKRASNASFDRRTSVELTDRRQRYTSTYRNTDGSETTVFSGEPLNYRDASGSWQRVRPGLVATGVTTLRSTGGSAAVTLGRAGTSAPLAGYRPADGIGIDWSLAGARTVAPTTRGATATWTGVLPGVDLTLTPQAAGVKELLVLHSRHTPRTFTFPLHLTGVTARLAGDEIELVDGSGTVRAVVPAGTMSDSAAVPATSAGVHYALSGAPGHQSLQVRLDARWLADPSRTYPVEVDPTVAAPAASSALTVSSNGTTGGGQELQVGVKGGVKSAAYLAFPGVSSSLQYQTIYGAQLGVVNFDSASCSPRAVGVYPVTASWSSSDTGLRYPGPAVGARLASQSYAKGYVGLGESASKCPVDAMTVYDLGARGRDLVQGWVNGAANNGLSLRASDTDSKAWKKFGGTATANPPKLYITHSPYNADYAIPNPVPNPLVLQNQAGAVKVTVTNRGAETWTPSNYYLAYRAFDAAGHPVGQQRAASLPGNLARNASVTLTATIKAMPAGSYTIDFTMVHTGGPIFTDDQVPPGRLLLTVYNIPPVLTNLYPANGFQSPTLTPQLWAQAIDKDAPSSGLTYQFEICPATGACTTSAYQSSPAWTVPAGLLKWNGTYTWRTRVKDSNAAVTTSPDLTLLTPVPQPVITGHLANSPYGSQDQAFDPLVGNYATAALDAPVTTVGPDLAAARTYNSLDPRTTGAFGAGWSSMYDMKLVTETDGTGNVLITYPDGTEVRFGKNPDGSYVAPASREDALTWSSSTSTWTLRDATNQTYTFASSGLLTQVKGPWGKPLTLSYTNGKVTKATSGDSGRYLTFTWTGAHVTSVSTNPVNGTALTWTYTYSGDQLTQACAADGSCTTYAQSTGSHYRSAVLDDRPDSYWRLAEPAGAQAGASEIGVNLGVDAAALGNVTLGTAGALAGTTDTAGTFSGTSSAMTLPAGTAKKSRDMAVELWFKTTSTLTNPLLGYQDKALSSTPGTGVPMLYVGTDGKLRGQFWTGTIAPITSATTVNNGQWHHVVLSVLGSSETMYLDGAQVGTATANVNHATLTYAQVGAAYATSASWPGYGAARRTYFTGSVDEVALYSHPISSADVTAHWKAGTVAAAELSQVTLPSGRIAAAVRYDVAADRVQEYTDGNGGTWTLTRPAYSGSATDLRKTILVRDPGNRPYLYEYDGIGGWLLRTGTPQATGVRTEDNPPAPTQPPTTPVCTNPDPGDPAFCTYDAGTGGGAPTFTTWDADGMSIRSYSYDANGQLQQTTNEVGATIAMTYDAHGNVTSRTTCRTGTQCYTTRYTFPTGLTDPLDPRWSLPTESRDGRSASASDNTYRTTSTYDAQGDLTLQTAPDGATVRTTYSSGSEAAVGGGTIVSGLPLTTTDPRGAVTTYGYSAANDLVRITEPSGQVTNFGYDAVGRKISQTEVSDTFPAGVTTTYTYDALSRLLTTTEPATTDAVTGVRHQRRTTLTYDVDGNVLTSTVSDLLGGDAARTTTFSYDDFGHMETATDPAGGETTYTYDRFGNKTSMTDANGSHWVYAYTARNTIAEERLVDPDETGSTSYRVVNSYAYDPAGRLAAQTDAMGRTVTIEYYGDDLIKTKYLTGFHNADGSTRTYVLETDTYDGAGNLTKQVSANGTRTTSYVRDAVGRIATVTDDPGGLNRSTSYTYDLGGNVTRTTSTGNWSNVSGANPAQTRVTTAGYDTAGRQTSMTTTLASGVTATTTSTYDQLGNVTAETSPAGNVTGADTSAWTTNYTYDEVGRQVAQTAPQVAVESGGQAPTTLRPRTAAGYDTFDDVVETRDVSGVVSTFGYDTRGNQVSASAPSYAVPATGATLVPTTSTTYDALGNVLTSVDQRGFTTRYDYDRLGRVTSVDAPLGTDAERGVTTYSYTATGELAASVDPTGARTEATYDDLDRQVTSTAFERAPQNDTFTTTTSYDDAGDAVKITSPLGNVTSSSYDALGQLTSVTDAAGVQTRYGYDPFGTQAQLTDGMGRYTRQTYDLGGRMTGEADYAADGTQLRSQSYAYDVEGNVTSATTGTGHTTTYTYDNLDRLTQQVEPVSASATVTTSFGYDAAGNRTRYTDGRGNSTYYTVNALGLPESSIQPATTAQPAAADRTWTISYDAAGQPVTLTEPGGVRRDTTYDAAGRVTAVSGSGAEVATTAKTLGYDADDRVTSVSAPGGTDTFTYDDRSDLLTSAGPAGATSYTYDGEGNVTRRVDVAGTASFGYTSGRLSSETDAVTGLGQSFGYDASGAVASIGYGSGRTQKFGYDSLGRLTSQTLVNSANSTVASATYGYDLDNNVTSKTTTGVAGAGSNTYSYDWLNRLTSWTSAAGTTAYGWDASSNRVQAGSKTSTYDARNRLLSDATSSYSYTARGTMRTKTTGGTTRTYAFDAYDRMISDGSATNTYDALDRLMTSGTASMRYDGTSDDLVSDGTQTFGRDADGDLISLGSSTTKRMLLSDQHGDVIGGFDPANTSLTALNDSRSYDPWGQQTATAGAGYDVGYQGEWTAPASGQVQMGSRWYDPSTGAFDSQDSVDDNSAGSVLANRYLYAGGNPVTDADPTGNWPCFSCAFHAVTHAVSHTVSSVVHTVSHVASTAYHYVSHAVSTAWNYAWDYAKKAASFVWNTVKTVAHAVSSAASWVYHKAKSAVQWVGHAVSTAVSWTAQKAQQAAQWAREKAAQAAAAAHRVAVATMQKAKSVISYAIKHSPLPAIAAVVKPLYTGVKTLVSAVAHLPAAVVAVTINAVKDIKSAVTVAYQAAVQAAGTVVHAVSTAVAATADFAAAHWKQIVTVAAGIAVGLGCTALTAGVGAAACMIAGAAVVGALSSSLNCPPGKSLAGCAARGAVAGAVGGAVMVATGGLGSGVAIAALSGGASSMAQTATQEYLDTGHVDAESVALSGALGAAGGAAAGGIAKARLGRGDAADTAPAGSCPIGGNSFSADTRVRMADGSTKPIDQVQVGDKVLATDTRSAKQVVEKVTHVWINHDDDLLDLQITLGGRTATIRTTAHHPFWNPAAHKWVDAQTLRAGTALTTDSGAAATVRTTRVVDGADLRWDLTVADVHDFYVVAASVGVLVHNCGSSLRGVDRGDGRDAFGKFTGQGGYGASAQAQGLVDYTTATGRGVVSNQVRATLPDGTTRYYDGLAHLGNGRYEGVEVKGGSASRNASQRAFDGQVDGGTPASARLNGSPISIVSTHLVKVP